MIKIFINFITEGQGERQIQEPDGFDASKFSIEQEDKRYGRDVLFAGGESNFGLNNRSKHYFELVLKYFEIYGFEAEAELIFRSGTIEKVYDIDFATMTTNQVDVIQFKAIQKSKEILLKRRSDVNIDLLSVNTLDKKPIFACVPENVLIKAKPIVGFSEWESPSQSTGSISYAIWNGGGIGTSNVRRLRVAINNSQVQKKDGLKNSLTFISPSYALIDSNGGVPDEGLNFTYLEAEDDIFDVKIKLSEIVGFSNTFRTGETDILHPEYRVNSAQSSVKIQVRIGFDIEISSTTVYTLYEKLRTYRASPIVTPPPDDTVQFPSELSLNVPIIKRGQRVWIYVNPDVNANITGRPGQTLGGPAYNVNLVMQKMKVSISGTSVAYPSVNPGIRLYDAMKYICKSASEMDIDAPEYSLNNKFYDQFLFTGKFLRGITNDGFKMNFEEITKGIVETNSDYQIQTNDTVFFGTYKNFYNSKEIAVIEGVQFEDYQKQPNERYEVNILKYKFNQYQSQKEKEIENTIDVVHGETEWLLMNKNVENKKEVEVSWIRDAFLIEEMRKKGYNISDTTASQDDDKKAILDCIPLTEADRTYKTTAFLQHTMVDGLLYLKNTSLFSFLLLGIAVGDTFTIIPVSENQGQYTVTEVTGNTLKLQPNIGTIVNFQGERDTEFQYRVSEETAMYTIWTDEGFTAIENIANGGNFANLRFSAKRNIINYYSEYLATCNIFCKKEIDNTLYNNNPKAITVYDGIRVEEGEPFMPLNPILTPFIHNCQFRMSMSEYIKLENKIRDERGYVRFIDNLKNTVRGYIKSANLTNQIDEQGFLECVIEEKYQPAILSIFSDNLTGIIIFNEEISVDSDNWSWYFNDELDYLHIFDATGLLLFTPMHFTKVMINGAIKETRIELEESLNLL